MAIIAVPKRKLHVQLTKYIHYKYVKDSVMIALVIQTMLKVYIFEENIKQNPRLRNSKLSRWEVSQFL